MLLTFSKKYGNPDPSSAFRAALIMKHMGVNNIRVLNGGFDAWLRKDFPLESKYNGIAKARDHVSDENVRIFEVQASNIEPSLIRYVVGYSFMSTLVNDQALFNQQYQIVDIRTREEYLGEASGYAELNHKGRIPGSVWGRAGATLNSLEDYRNPDLTMRPGNEILKMWDDLVMNETRFNKRKNLSSFICIL